METLQGMGFTPVQATAALKASLGSLERAADWLFTRDDIDKAVAEVLAPAPAAQAPRTAEAAAASSSTAPLDDGPGI